MHGDADRTRQDETRPPGLRVGGALIGAVILAGRTIAPAASIGTELLGVLTQILADAESAPGPRQDEGSDRRIVGDLPDGGEQRGLARVGQ